MKVTLSAAEKFDYWFSVGAVMQENRIFSMAHGQADKFVGIRIHDSVNFKKK